MTILGLHCYLYNVCAPLGALKLSIVYRERRKKKGHNTAKNSFPIIADRSQSCFNFYAGICKPYVLPTSGSFFLKQKRASLCAGGGGERLLVNEI